MELRPRKENFYTIPNHKLPNNIIYIFNLNSYLLFKIIKNIFLFKTVNF